MAEAKEPPLPGLNALVGEWDTEATHRMLPSTVVQGHSVFEWLEGEKFLIMRARMDHLDFPDSISIIGDTGRPSHALLRFARRREDVPDELR